MSKASIPCREPAFLISLGRRLRAARTAVSLTQAEMAARLDIARQTLISYETGRTDPPSGLLAQICNDFQIDAGWLLMGSAKLPVSGKQRARGA